MLVLSLALSLGGTDQPALAQSGQEPGNVVATVLPSVTQTDRRALLASFIDRLGPSCLEKGKQFGADPAALAATVWARGFYRTDDISETSGGTAGFEHHPDRHICAGLGLNYAKTDLALDDFAAIGQRRSIQPRRLCAARRPDHLCRRRSGGDLRDARFHAEPRRQDGHRRRRRDRRRSRCRHWFGAARQTSHARTAHRPRLRPQPSRRFHRAGRRHRQSPHRWRRSRCAAQQRRHAASYGLGARLGRRPHAGVQHCLGAGRPRPTVPTSRRCSCRLRSP